MLVIAAFLLFAAGGFGAGSEPPGQMQSRAVETRVQFEIEEGRPKGTIVATIPTKPGFTYRFNEPPSEFTMNSTTGEIRTTTILDRESLASDRFDLVVLSSQPTYPIEVRIFVTDINDNAPEFPEPSIAVSFSESAVAGTRILLDAATDRDTGVNSVTDDYRIVAGNIKEKFRLEVTANPSGETSYLHLQTTGDLDREERAFYQLNISARDGGTPPKYGHLLVNVTVLDVNDNPPIFDHSDYNVSMNESVPAGTRALQVMATDNDVGDNAKITYYLSESERKFTVDPETGVITTAEPLDCPPQNCPMASNNCSKSCVFTVYARDHGSPRQDGRTYVTVNLIDANDHDPMIRFRYFFPVNVDYATVDENAVNGSVVAAVSVQDLDVGLNGDTSVEIKSGNELNHFSLEYSETFHIVRVNGVLDREQISKYNLTIVATDKGTPPRTDTAFLIIHVNDVNDHEPVFEKTEYSAILSELAPPGSYVAGITATDEDTGVNAQIFYAFVSGNEHNWFEIDTNSGLITTKAELDREVQGTVELKISARDGGPNPKWAYTHLKIMVLDENDEKPTFSQNQFNVSLSESKPAGTLVAMLSAVDHDQGTNGSVTYSLHPDVQRLYPGVFTVNSLTGKLSTNSKLDREAISHYEIKVVANDQGVPPQSSTATVSLQVQDVNDNSPEFYPLQYFILVSENHPVGTSIVGVTAQDQDDGDNALISYSIEEGGGGIFMIDSRTGVITVQQHLGKTQQAIYKLRISARDKGGRKAVEDAQVELIKESHAQELKFDAAESYSFHIQEDHDKIEPRVGRKVGRVQVRPFDSQVRYSIVYGDSSRSFRINDKTGEITTQNRVDRERFPFYNLVVAAKSGLSFGKAIVNITVLDVNDNQPEFAIDRGFIRIAENAAVGQEIYLATATDKDTGENSRVSFKLSFNPDNHFRIVNSTGVIYLNKPLRGEPGTSLNLEVAASDSGIPPLTSQQTVTIFIEDVNDHTPVFDHTSYETSLLESTAVNDRFFALSASDADLDLNGLISYAITEGNHEGKFGVFPDGYMYVKSPLDREEKDYYSLTVRASDHGVPSRSSIVPLVIHVIDENDNRPQFTNASFNFFIRENEPPDSFVGKLTATDNDSGRNAELTFSIGSAKSDFVVDPKNGFIKTLHAFDREELIELTGQDFITLEATVTDNGTPRLKDKTKVNVYISDENDNPPEFLRLPYRVVISEGSSVGTQILRVFTTDADEGLNGDVFYTISTGNQDGKFIMNESTGQITIAKMLDRETTSKYELTVVAHDASTLTKLSATATVNIDVLDENDSAPEFTQTNTKITVLENTTVNTELIQFRASDTDLGINSEITFSIGSGNRRDTFHIDPNTGSLFLHKPLDYEELSYYSLNITASDGGNPKLSTSLTFIVTVEDCNDNPPVFTNTAIVRQIHERISENTPIVTVTAEDPDSGTNGQITYSISRQEPEDPNQPGRMHFDIDKRTGVIRTRLPIDRELIDTFRLTVVATDQAEPPSARMSAEKLVTVIVEDVNDNAPIFVSMIAAVLPPPRSAHQFIMSVQASDIDSSTNGLVTYDVISGNTEFFDLNRNTGYLTLRKKIINPETKYQIAIKATDEAVQSDRKSTDTYITLISTGSVGPVFSNGSLSGSIFENEPPGTTIVTVKATAGRAEDVEFFVTNVTEPSGRQAERFFEIDAKTGVLASAVILDKEAGQDWYLVTVYAIVANSRIPRTSFTQVRVNILDKNDSPPSFEGNPSEISVSEETDIGEAVGVVKATDPDTIGKTVYSLVSGSEGKFALSDSGVLTLKEPLDRETRDSYGLRIKASDGVQASHTLLTIKVTDMNDNPPVFLESVYSFDVSEETVRGAKVGTVSARDPDLAENGRVSFSVISDWANDVFSLNPQTGIFTLTARLDYEEVQHYIFVVEAEDGGKPALSSTVSVYINVLDVNDNAPLFDPMSYSNEVFENATIGSSIVTVTATDLDSGNNGRVEYSIVSGDDNNVFSIDIDKGIIRTRRLLDRETKALYNLVVIASDQAKSPLRRLSSTVQVSIVVKDVNDMWPEFVTPKEASVAENSASGTLIMAVKAVDKDEGRNGYVEYRLGGEGASSFTLGPVDGLLRVAHPLDRERQANYSLEITAKDRGDPPRSTRSHLQITVLDMNDNAPVFDPKQYSASIPENASIGASVHQVSASDVDEGLNGLIRFSIIGGDENRDFSIGEDSGVVRVAKNLNFERKSRYSLRVRAEDCSMDSPVQHDIATITVSVVDINDNPPTFLDSPYLAYVMENVVPPPDGYVMTVSAYDADTQPFNGQVRYFLKEENENGLFRINSSTGVISLLKPLDREKQAEHILTLVAMDTGAPPLTGSGSVKVVVQDVNDHSPEFDRSMYVARISENLPVNTFVVHPTATDLDAGLNAKIRYNLVGENVERFKVDADTGVITTAIELDREELGVYYLTFVARDCSVTEPKATAVNLTIFVKDENDNAPKFLESSFSVHVPDKTEQGKFIFGAKAYDLDEGVNSRISYSISGRDSGKFTLDSRTGVIKAAVELSFKERSGGAEYKLNLIATDGGQESKTASADLTVKLVPVMNFPVIRSPSVTQFTLQEDVEAGKLITRVTATSTKLGKAGEIRYAIAGSNIGDAIKVDPISGEVSVAGGGLDYETSSLYEVWIEARDSDSPPLRSVVQLFINITDANDNAPVMELPVYNAVVPEEEPPPQKVITISATDNDAGENGRVSYRLRDDANGAFAIDGENGEIFTNARLDREKITNYQLIVEAVDSGVPSLTGTATVMVSILDVNDNPPRFTRLFSVNVTENAEVGSFVIRVMSSDLDIGENANATYSFKENPGNKFKIDPITGNVTVAGFLDRETQEEYFLNVLAYDGAWTAGTPITVTIQDQNDNAPEFDHSFYSFNFPELQRNVMFVGQVLASDRDKHGPNSVISYSLKYPSDLFTIDPASGELFSKRPLRYKFSASDSSPENQYSLTVLATDNGKPPMSSECLVTVNVVDANNNAPKFELREYFSPVLQTAQVDQEIIKVDAKDVQDYGVNAEIEYVIVGGNGTNWFTINKTSGWISLNRVLENRFEEQTQFTLKVRAFDHGVPSQHDEIPVTLVLTGENRHTPVFTALSYQVNVHENDPISSVIVTVAASDADEGPNGMLRYMISSGNYEEHFMVNPISGSVSILHELDYDTVKEYKLNISAKDLAFHPRSAEATLTVILTDINDNPPTFNQTEYNAVIAENSPPNSFVYQVRATDIDSPKNAIIQYSIVGGSGKDYFKIDDKTGIISSKVKFDYEEKNMYTVDILAVNPDSPMYGSTKVIVRISGVNEYYPSFIQPVFHFEVSESAEVGTSVGIIQATDQDSGDDGKVYYLFVGSSNDKGFNIFSESGVITVSRRLDRETQNRIVLTVMAKNAGGIRGNDTDECQVIISVQDGNDPPEFIQSLYETDISEAVPQNTKLITVKAVDKDVKLLNNQFSYSILSGNKNQAFKIDSQTGEIETVAVLDRETTPYYSLIIGAIDNGSPPETGTATVKVIVTDVNDNGPSFDPPQVTGFIVENEPPNTSVMTLSATDPDLPPNGAPFFYTLAGGRDKDYVRIERATGVVKTTRMLDRETTPTLEILVEIEDSGEPKMKSQHPVTISVLDQNDNPSTPRTVHVVVFTFNGVMPIGKIADVHPNDADTTGDYHCALLTASSAKGLFSIPTGCSLHSSRINVGSVSTLSVSGNDGRHGDVVSTVTVEFLQFDNATVENSITVRIENITAYVFLSQYYKSFLEFLKTAFKSNDVLYLYSMDEKENGLELTLAVYSGKEYKSKSSLIDVLNSKLDSIRALLHSSKLIVGYSPCHNATCQNGGDCSEAINVVKDTRIIDSQSLIFTSPLVNHEFTCRCPEGFTGTKCDKRQDPCSPNPCLAGGTCKRQGYDFVCVCSAMREGKVCESERGDLCSGNPCQNGGSCRESPGGSSFFCLCRPGYRGTQCEVVTDSCRPNPCLHGGQCISLKPGYRCNCLDSRHGRHCEKSTFGFSELSYMTFPPLDGSVNDMSVTFATTKPDALLIYNYGPQTGGRSDFVSLELVNGKALFSYGGTSTAITSVSVKDGADSLADGEWHKITATRNGRLVSLSVSSCTDNGDTCKDCKPGDPACYVNVVGPAGTLNFNTSPMYLGGIKAADAILERPGQVHSDDLVGCVHSVSINGRLLNLTNPLASRGILPTCPRSGKGPCSAPVPSSSSEGSSTTFVKDTCDDLGVCHDRWNTVLCTCGASGLISPNCYGSLEPVTLSDGAFIEFKITETHRRVQLLDSIYGGSTLWFARHVDRSRRNAGKTAVTAQAPRKQMSVLFKTYKTEGTIFFAATNNDFTAIQLINGQPAYVSRLGSTASVNMTIHDLIVSDGHWHNITLESHHRELRMLVDGVKVGDELDSVGVHDFLDPYLSQLFVGGMKRDSAELIQQSFTGCLANFTINNEIQPLNGSGSIFPEVILHGRGKLLRGCSGALSVGAAVTTDPLSIGVSLVLVFFVILLIAILASFVVFRLRRQAKEKTGGMKSNGGGSLRTGAGGGLGVVSDGRSGPLPEGANFITENGDVIRGVGGHHLVGPELISKKYKDQDVMSEHQQRTQRPDIIEREVVSKSPPREDHHPPLPMTHHGHDQPSVMDSDLPEHYDLENSSSIAPSDIDIVYHYKRYREGSGNLRKYKSTPPHLPPGASVYHKHSVTTPPHHRHSPHFPSRSVLPPPPVSRVDSPSKIQHQSTPLARLSPSSELSQQMPRILTLQDISGKPLQSALLAATSSSGGVGKDVLNSNSERSLNSPVMSQLSGQSSTSRKTPGGGGGGGSSGAGGTSVPGGEVGLSADEIGRLNSRGRTSSLVSTLDAVSSSSGAPPPPTAPMHLHRPTEQHDSDESTTSTTTDESGNDSFTCSEIEYDNASVTNEKTRKQQTYDFDSSFRGSLSTLVASDDDSHPPYRPRNSSPGVIGLDYLLNWGPNFESLVGVFKDIAELPETNGRVSSSLRLPNGSTKPSEEYV